ncbi:MAG: glycerol kinase GlpK [Bacteroidia bacterium]
MTATYILALDQGTTSSRAILFDSEGRIAGIAQQEFTQYFPQPGWVEHDPMEILQSQLHVARAVLKQQGVAPAQVAAIGITNQRETTVVWDRTSGQPVYRAIVWQDRRTAALCDDLKQRGLADHVRQHTGLVIDAYFSGTKVRWILDHLAATHADIPVENLCFGTIDSWLIWNLTGGQVHATDYSNASRTLLFDIHQLDWDAHMLEALAVPRSLLPEVRPSSGDFGHTLPALFDGVSIPIRGVAGDQQAALFGQACFEPGMSKNTYGTGCFMLMNTGSTAVHSSSGLLTSLTWSPEGQVQYVQEGSIFIAGAAIQWLRDGLKILDEAPDSEFFAMKVPDSGGVVVVPAFAGLGAPYWDMYARGAIFGLTRGSTKAHIVRATLESLAFQTRDVLEAMKADAGTALGTLRVDGGASANNLLMQFQADILDAPVERPAVIETTALGAAYLAGLAIGYWTPDQLRSKWHLAQRFTPRMEAGDRDRRYARWKKAVSRSMDWEVD